MYGGNREGYFAGQHDGYGVGVGDAAGGPNEVVCARSRSVSGLRTIFSSVNRFRAETGGQFLIKTESSIRSPTNGESQGEHPGWREESSGNN